VININEILSTIGHRPFALPTGQWKYYQEWNNVLFFHWTIPVDILQKCVPEKYIIDTFNGKCYVSVVAFTMQKIRPRYLPSISLISDFNEINLRTYIENNSKKGVYFLNIESGKLISNFIARSLSGLPYEKADIKRTKKKYTSTNLKKGIYLDAEFEIKDEIEHKTELDKWLTERYCLYFDKGNRYYRYDIHHKEWKLKKIEIRQLKLNYRISDMNLSGRQPTLTHYSDGVKVLAWKRHEM
jgi:uncharacterized protein